MPKVSKILIWVWIFPLLSARAEHFKICAFLPGMHRRSSYGSQWKFHLTARFCDTCYSFFLFSTNTLWASSLTQTFQVLHTAVTEMRDHQGHHDFRVIVDFLAMRQSMLTIWLRTTEEMHALYCHLDSCLVKRVPLQHTFLSERFKCFR